MNEKVLENLRRIVPPLTNTFPEIGTILWVGSSVRESDFKDVDLALIRLL
jgi:hypothetical protein